MDNDPNISLDLDDDGIDPRNGSQRSDAILDERSGSTRGIPESVENVPGQNNTGGSYPGPDVIESDNDEDAGDEDESDDQHPTEPDEDNGLEENVDEDEDEAGVDGEEADEEEDLPGADQNQQSTSR